MSYCPSSAKTFLVIEYAFMLRRLVTHQSMQSHYIEVSKGAIFMRFELIIGNTEKKVPPEPEKLLLEVGTPLGR